MTRKEWEALNQARRLLGLGETATRSEIRRAYYRLSKQHHPDQADVNKKNTEKMYQLTRAYELLSRYMEQYSFPLTPGDQHIYDAEDWWMERFGPDHHWRSKG